jgi:hypothetical protein
VEAGAKFVITQPIVGRDPNVDRLKNLGIPIVIEAWMSKNIDLLYKSVGKKDGGISVVAKKRSAIGTFF